LYFLWLASAEEAMELRPIVPAAIAILVRKDLRLTPEIESFTFLWAPSAGQELNLVITQG
jgi:hypothetical protein